MDSNYIISRLKSTIYKYPTVEVLRSRLRNLEENKREEIVSDLKIELCKHGNVDINGPLFELIYKLPLAS